MALQLQLAENPAGTDYPFFNYTTADIPAGVYVKIDSGHVISAANQSQQGIGVDVAGSDGDNVIGMTRTIIPKSSYGAVRCFGPIAVGTADGTITAGNYVMASGGASKKGFVKAAGSAKGSGGLALTTAADAEPVAVMLGGALNA